MIVIENFTPITKLGASATQAEVIAKVNELVDCINDLVPKHTGEDGIVDEA
jgi:hypothetical protein